jgi:spermidine synthase
MGSTTYALSTMLGTFMAGLAIGGLIGGKLADRGKNLLLIFGLLEFGIGAFGMITIPLIYSLPPLYFKLHKSFHFFPPALFQFLLCSGIMLVPTTLMGATFPIVSRKLTTSMDEMGKWVGEAYSVNTFGAILGSFSAGFFMIPVLGVKVATLIAASLNVAVAVLMIVLSRARHRGGVLALFILLLSAPFVVSLISQEEDRAATLYNIERYDSYDNFRADSNGELLWDHEYVEGRVKLWRHEKGHRLLQVGARSEGTSLNDMDNTLLLSYVPLASHPRPESFLLIGLGTGVTLQAVKEHVGDLSVAEINRGVIEAVNEFGAGVSWTA